MAPAKAPIPSSNRFILDHATPLKREADRAHRPEASAEFDAKEKPMIYELLLYQAMPGRLAALIARFQNHTLRIWEKHGIRQVGFWTTLVGDSQQRLTYMLAWDSMDDREKRWNAFLADSEWSSVVSQSERDGPLTENIANEFLAPTPFSSLK
jgi:hypothetical protein